MDNPFQDTEMLPDGPVLTSDNPYSAPVVSGKGEYDWTLAKQAFLAVAGVACIWLLAGAIGSYREFSQFGQVQVKPPLEQVRDFFFGWPETPKAPSQSE